MDNDVFFNKKGDKITSFVNHCYIIRGQRARKNHRLRKKFEECIAFFFERKICDEKCCQIEK
jgi:hypothetical protein